jgi:hypothetical protein
VWSDAVHDRAIRHHHWLGLTPYLSEKKQDGKKFEGTFVLQGNMRTASSFSSSIKSYIYIFLFIYLTTRKKVRPSPLDMVV